MWGRTHTSLVGEQTTSNTVFDSLRYCYTGKTTDSSFWIKCTDKNHSEYIWQLTDVHDDQNKGTDDVESCHDWNQLLSYRCDTSNAAQEDECCQDSYCDTNEQRVDTECALESVTNRVGLYHVAEEAQSQDNKDCKCTCQNFTQSAFVSCADVVYRSSGYFAGFVGCFKFLCQGCLYEDGSHAEDCGYPHPEDSTRTTHYHCGCSTGKVTCTYLSSNRSCQRLERGHTVFACFSAVEIDVAENGFKSTTELSKLYTAQTDGEPQTSTYQKYYQQFTGQEVRKC